MKVGCVFYVGWVWFALLCCMMLRLLGWVDVGCLIYYVWVAGLVLVWVG